VSISDAPLSDAPSSDAPWPTAPPGAPGLKVGFPGAHELASPAPRVSHRAKLLLLVVGLGILTVTLVVVALLAAPGPPPNCSPLNCQGPPIGHRIGQIAVEDAHGAPVLDGVLYRNAQGFTVRYPQGASVQTDAQGVQLTYDFNTGGPSSIEILGAPSGGATPQSTVEGFAGKEFPDTQPVYELPNPLIGYQPAYGVAFNVQPASSDGSTGTDQVVVAAAVDNGFVIVVQVVGALQPTVDAKSPFFNGHPSPAGTNLAYFVGDFILNRIGFP
jgi:hypothetical protein